MREQLLAATARSEVFEARLDLSADLATAVSVALRVRGALEARADLIAAITQGGAGVPDLEELERVVEERLRTYELPGSEGVTVRICEDAAIELECGARVRVRIHVQPRSAGTTPVASVISSVCNSSGDRFIDVRVDGLTDDEPRARIRGTAVQLRRLDLPRLTEGIDGEFNWTVREFRRILSQF